MKREVIQDIDQFAQMLVIIKENSQSDEFSRKLPRSMKLEWKSICDMDMHTQIFL